MEVAAGELHVNLVGETKIAGAEPMSPNLQLKCSVLTKPAPVTVTRVPPVSFPEVGDTEVTVGRVAKANTIPDAVLSTSPFDLISKETAEEGEEEEDGGDVQDSIPEESRTASTSVDPKKHEKSPAKLEPYAVTVVPPVAGPVRGEIAVIETAGLYVYVRSPV